MKKSSAKTRKQESLGEYLEKRKRIEDYLSACIRSARAPNWKDMKIEQGEIICPRCHLKIIFPIFR